MSKNLPVICSAVVLALFASCAFAAGERMHSYTLPHSGELRLTTPDTWRDNIEPAEEGMPPTIDFRPASGDAFQVKVTPLAPPADATSMAMPSQKAIRASVERGRAQAARQAVEKHIVVHRLRSPHAAGYYFTATDKAPGHGPDDFPIMTHFEVVSGRVLLLVTAFYNDNGGKVREQAIAMLKSAQFKPGDSGEPRNKGGDSDERLEVNKVRGGYRLTVPVSRLAVILHSNHLQRQPGGSASPRYFFFDDNSHGAIISGWFDSADNFPGIKPFWEREGGAIKDHQPPGPLNVTFDNVGKWQVVAYGLKFPGGKVTSVNMRAERVQAGTWLDLHLSMTSKLSTAKARARLVAVLKSIEVREKAE